MARSNHPIEPEDIGTNASGNPYFGDVILTRLRRRQLRVGGLRTFALSMFGPSAWEETQGHLAGRQVNTLNFESVGRAPIGNDLLVPEGYQYKALLKWGDPIGSIMGAPPFRSNGAKRAANRGVEAELQFGDNHDGLEFLPLPFGWDSTQRALLVINHESVRAAVISGFRFVRSADPAMDTQHDPEAVRKQKASHGVSVAEVYRNGGGECQVQMNSRYAFKVHADTEIEITGPAHGHAAMRTRHDPRGVMVKGTLGNCGSGLTPWGTYLTCEEDSHKNYFYTRDWAVDDPRNTQPRWRRYGVVAGNEREYTWHFVDERFHVNKEPNEPNRFGWVVEIDPFDRSRKPAKRTALGRFA